MAIQKTHASAGDIDALALLEPVELIETDQPFLAEPPESWNPDAHHDADRWSEVELTEVPETPDLDQRQGAQR